MPRRILSPRSFRIRRTCGRESPSMPDYYRKTRLEHYDPYRRASLYIEPLNIDDSEIESLEFCSSFMLDADIFDDDFEIASVVEEYKPLATTAKWSAKFTVAWEALLVFTSKCAKLLQPN
ncbi:hypothetical protein PLEOSDRAFT_1087674 [Pleurotus ostreatus PC15]|uniref:Uncharacterized protein n=2 Tax=Pleurotus ostreatus TaxID=5322 RepID=A0A067P1I4_PLEO1|nr:hypothetical protein PLEOSDRAFT_1087674 [Pleurotus ostreatus PC15]